MKKANTGTPLGRNSLPRPDGARECFTKIQIALMKITNLLNWKYFLVSLILSAVVFSGIAYHYAKAFAEIRPLIILAHGAELASEIYKGGEPEPSILALKYYMKLLEQNKGGGTTSWDDDSSYSWDYYLAAARICKIYVTNNLGKGIDSKYCESAKLYYNKNNVQDLLEHLGQIENRFADSNDISQKSQ